MGDGIRVLFMCSVTGTSTVLWGGSKRRLGRISRGVSCFGLTVSCSECDKVKACQAWERREMYIGLGGKK